MTSIVQYETDCMRHHVNKKRVVAVIPCFNEEESLFELTKALNKVRLDNKVSFELDVIFINDGSTDNTQQIIEILSKEDKHIFYRNFAHNAGHQSAIRAGLDVASSYDAVIMLDADLQHPPKYIKAMVQEWQNNGVSIVQMLRRDNHKEVGMFKYMTSRGYYWLINKLSGLDLEYGSSDFRLIDQGVVRTISMSPEKDLFLRGYFSWLSVKRSNLEYQPSKRFAGSSKYTLRKMLALAKRGILQFSEKPLRIAINLGLFIAAASIIYGVYLIWSYLHGAQAVSGWTSLMAVTLFCFGINFVLIGFIGRYLAHSIEIQKQRPEYIIVSEKLPV